MKYRLTDETINYFGKTLYRIESIQGGEKGGFIESEKNLSQDGDAWVSGDARVYGNAWVSGGKHIVPPLYIQGSKHSVTVNTPDIINIGCQSGSVSWWLEKYKAAGRAGGYTKKQIEEYGKYLTLIADILA